MLHVWDRLRLVCPACGRLQIQEVIEITKCTGKLEYKEYIVDGVFLRKEIFK